MLLALLACTGPGSDSADKTGPEGVGEGDGPDGEEEVIYTGEIVDLRLELSAAAISGLATTAEQEVDDVRASFFFGDTRLVVGLHLKGGGGSFQPITGKPSFKIDFGQFSGDQRFHGYKHMTLNNMVQDGSMLAEHGAYALYAAQGLPAPRHAYARLTVNDQPFGLYSVVETLDENFVDRAFEGPDGPLYEGNTDLIAGYEPLFDVSVADTDGAELVGLIAALDGATPETFLATLEVWFDTDQLFDAWAIELVTGNPDGYVTRTNNYALYWDPEASRFTMVPWGADLTFAADLDVTRVYIARMYTSCLEVPACVDALYGRMAGVLETWDRMGFSDWMVEEAARIEPDCLVEPRIPGAETSCRAGQTGVLNFVADRPTAVRAQLGI